MARSWPFCQTISSPESQSRSHWSRRSRLPRHGAHPLAGAQGHRGAGGPVSGPSVTGLSYRGFWPRSRRSFSTARRQAALALSSRNRDFRNPVLSLSPAVHVEDDARSRPRDEKNMAVRLDERVHSREEVAALGIEAGDYVCYEPKTQFTPSGFLKNCPCFQSRSHIPTPGPALRRSPPPVG